jgi:hypothetical protein
MNNKKGDLYRLLTKWVNNSGHVNTNELDRYADLFGSLPKGSSTFLYRGVCSDALLRSIAQGKVPASDKHKYESWTQSLDVAKNHTTKPFMSEATDHFGLVFRKKIPVSERLAYIPAILHELGKIGTFPQLGLDLARDEQEVICKAQSLTLEDVFLVHDLDGKQWKNPDWLKKMVDKAFKAKVTSKYQIHADNYTFKEVNGKQLVQLTREHNLFNQTGSFLQDAGYDWRDALGWVAYCQSKPVAWVLLDKDPEGKSDDALFMRYTDPAHRGKKLSVKLASKLIPMFRKKHPELSNLVMSKGSDRIREMWRYNVV